MASDKFDKLFLRGSGLIKHSNPRLAKPLSLEGVIKFIRKMAKEEYKITKEYTLLIYVTDCGDDRYRYEIATKRSLKWHNYDIAFCPIQSMNTLQCGFTAATALSDAFRFGSLRPGERIGMIVNAAPRLNGRDEEILALLLKNGARVIVPNAGYNTFFIKDQVAESFLVTDTSGMSTPFRSMQVMVPALAQFLGLVKNRNIKIERTELPEIHVENGLYIGGTDNHGNVYVVSTTGDDWIPSLNKSQLFRIKKKKVRLRHVDRIWAGKDGKLMLTPGSLMLNGKHIFYIVMVHGNAYERLGKPPIGTRIELI